VKSTIASFPTSTGNGTEPDGQLFIDSNGDLRGATVHGGTDPNPANQKGTTYEIAKIAGGYATTPTFLADIPGGLNTLVDVPNLSADANGDLFGLMFSGGESLNFPQAAAPKSNCELHRRHRRLQPGRAAAGRRQRQSGLERRCRAATMGPAQCSNTRRAINNWKL
jgi:hypothetical protein